jgi:membrane protein DedA with SNARE-associated domain
VFHAVVAFVAAAGETVPALYDADASLAPGALFLTVVEAALLPLAFALGALGRAVRDNLTFHLGRLLKGSRF